MRRYLLFVFLLSIVFKGFSQGLEFQSPSKKTIFKITGFGDLYFGKHWDNYNKSPNPVILKIVF